MEVAGGENSGEGGRQVNKAIFLEKKMAPNSCLQKYCIFIVGLWKEYRIEMIMNK